MKTVLLILVVWAAIVANLPLTPVTGSARLLAFEGKVGLIGP